MGGFNTKKETSNNVSISDSISSSMNQANQQAQQQSATQVLASQLPFLQGMWGAGANALETDPGVTDQARSAWGQAVNGTINPGVADVIRNASADMGLEFGRSTMPAIRRGAVGTGSLGGSRQGIAEGLAAGELARAQSTMATNLTSQALDQARQERTAALNMSGGMQALPWTGIEAFSRSMGPAVMESGATASSSGGSYGTSSGLMSASGSGAGSGSGMGFNILGKGSG